MFHEASEATVRTILGGRRKGKAGSFAEKRAGLRQNERPGSPTVLVPVGASHFVLYPQGLDTVHLNHDGPIPLEAKLIAGKNVFSAGYREMLCQELDHFDLPVLVPLQSAQSLSP